MKKFFVTLIFAAISPILAQAQQAVTVGYFKEWPLPAHYGKQANTFSEALRARVNWPSFDRAADMSTALENGTIDIALSQGIVPLLVAASEGRDVEIVDIAVSYAGAENCVVRARLNISQENATALEGLEVALPIGTTVHFSLLKQMTHLGVDASKLVLTDMTPARAASAFENAEVDMACGWGDALERMKKRGNVLLDGSELTDIGVLAFDTIVIQNFYGISNADLLTKILDINDKLVFSYNSDPTAMIDEIAESVAMTGSATRATMDGFTFLPIDQKLSETWLGSGVQTYMKSLADFFVEQGTMNSALDSYDDLVNVSYLQAVLALQLSETTNDSSLLAPQQQN